MEEGLELLVECATYLTVANFVGAILRSLDYLHDDPKNYPGYWKLVPQVHKNLNPVYIFKTAVRNAREVGESLAELIKYFFRDKF